VMNIAGGSRVSLNSVLQLLREVSGSRVEVIYGNKQPGDVQDTFADTESAQRLIHYRPLVALRNGLANEFQHMVSLYEQVRS